MNRPFAIHWAIAVQAVLATLIVGLGQGSALMPCAMISAVLLSLWLAKNSSRFHLNWLGVNATVLVAAASFAWRYSHSRGGMDMFIAADALALLQLALLFERKGIRTWWDLLSLSLFQVVLGSMWQHGPLFGLLLIPFAFSGLAAMVLLHQEQTLAGGLAAAKANQALGHGADEGSERTDWLRLLGIAAGTLLVGPLSLYLRFGRRGSSATDSITDRPSAAGRHPRGDAEDIALIGPPAEAGIHRELWWRLGGMTAVCFLCSSAVFVLAPRMGRVEFATLIFRGAHDARGLQRSVGFSGRVQLDEEEQVADSQEKVLEVQFVDYRTEEPYPIQGEIYLRGSVFNRYEKGRWVHYPGGIVREVPGVNAREAAGADALVRQLMTIEPLDRPELFGIWPFLLLDDEQTIDFDEVSQRLRRPEKSQFRRFSYQLVTDGLVEGKQVELVPNRELIDRQNLEFWPQRAVPRLAALADTWIRESDLPEQDTVGRARLLENQLRTSPRFSYSTGAIRRTRGLDPLEDFVASHPQGHCEFFASALALMLRSQGIPSRLVVGFKTSEAGFYNHTYRARQGHAHAWVEAFVPAEQLAGNQQLPPGEDWAYGGWLRLDPTPAGLAARTAGLAWNVRAWIDEARRLWTENVVRVDRSRQRRAIYRPAIQRLREVLALLGSGDWWNETVLTRLRAWSSNPRDLAGDLGKAWRTMLVALGIGMAAMMARSAWRAWPRPARRKPMLRAAASVARASDVEFYGRLERLLGRGGVPRRAAQTPLEFASDRASRLVAPGGEASLEHLARSVVSAFYQVRFGGCPLAPEQAKEVELALVSIRQATRNGHKKAVRPKPPPQASG